MKKKRTFITGIIPLILMVVWIVFYLNKTYVLSCDLRLHYEVALKLHLILEGGMQLFKDSTKYVQIIGYPGWHIIFLIINYLCRYLPLEISEDMLPIVAQAIENSVVLVITFRLIKLVYQRYFKINELWSNIFSIMMMFVGPLYLPIVNIKYYLGQFTANPWHNPTTIIVKPFAIGAFFLYCYIYDNRNNAKNRTNILLVCFSALLVIGGIMKPSFYETFVPALFVFCVVDVIITRFKSLWFCIKTGFAVIPVCILALVQCALTFTKEGIGGIILAPFAEWSNFTNNYVGSFLISFAFPIAVFCIVGFKKYIKKSYVLLSILLLCSSLSQFIVFGFENGGGAGDFIWGVYLAVAILFIVCSYMLWEYGKDKRDTKYYVTALIFGLHFLCGVGYFVACYIIGSLNI